MVSATTGLTFESLPEINLSDLSQSELHTLSLCSVSAFKLHNSNDIITPSVNPSIFNKSARQNYSRPYRRRRISPKPLSSDHCGPAHDPAEVEDRTIVGYLKNLLGDQEREFSGLKRVVEGDSGEFLNPGRVVEGNFGELSNPERVVESNSGAIVVYEDERNGRKRKRGGGGKSDVEVELSNVNSNGVVVNFQELGDSDEYYSEELKKRTEGLRTEEDGLGFLRGLNGKWCSRRKKRKFVDASEFGDKFPVGWKIILGLRRRNGCVSLYCRRYVSPVGEHFVSCKEASLYLQSYFRDRDNQKTDQMAANVEQVGNVASITHAGVVDKESDMQVDSIPSSSLNVIEHNILSTEKLYEVPIRAIFDCSKCELTFEQKSKYFEHMLEVHLNTTRMYTLDKSAGSGLVIDDEIYKRKERSTNEAQVGIHLNNKTKISKESPVQITDQKSSESPSDNGLLSRASMLGAVEEIAYHSMLEYSKDQPTGQPWICSSSNNLNPDISAANSDREQSLDYHLTEMGTGKTTSALAPKMKLRDGGHITPDENIIRINGVSDIGNGNVMCTRTSDHPKLGESKNYRSTEQGNCGVDYDDSNKLIVGAKKGATDSSVLCVQSLHCNPAAEPLSYKMEDVEQETVVLHNHGDARIEKVEPQIVVLYDSGNLEMEGTKEETIVLNNHGDAQIKEVEPRIVVLKDDGNVGMEDVEPDFALSSSDVCLITSVCVWCAKKFTRETVESEDHSESVGFMCPTCKATISKHLDNGFHDF
ncbi:hypothetical protein DCAR_0624327 [Daucus carota subsp. sativus]|uniref:C2H2-type domain-containing protein n=1 Tax=Daucus carota subsp. sativus TaxID=79200 RepID=A0AAF0XBT3_DAUCS|nr:hypothetical protein DCAR_0624327 [Daucus carota subsp. sativus]